MTVLEAVSEAVGEAVTLDRTDLGELAERHGVGVDPAWGPGHVVWELYEKRVEPGIFQPTATPAAATPLLTRLASAVAGFEADIRSGHPEGRHTVAHPFFGRLPTVDYLRLQAIHARHHRSQLT